MISIIIPVYNIEKYLEQCLSSIFNQSFKNIEVIIVDDGSTDNSFKIIEKYMNIYNSIVYLKQNNKGVSEARNLALKYAKGKYVLFIDPDDYLDVRMLEKIHHKAEKTNSDIVVVGYTAVYDDTIKGKNEDVITNVDDKKTYSGKEVAEMMLNGKVRGFLWDKLFRLESLKIHNFNFEVGRYIQDWYPVFRQITSSSSIIFINEPLYKYRQRGTSTVNKKNEKLLKDYVHASHNILNYVEKNKIEFNKASINNFKVEMFLGIIGYYYRLNKEKCIKVYREFKESEYKQYEISIQKLFLSRKLKSILKSLMWKFRVYHLVYKNR